MQKKSTTKGTCFLHRLLLSVKASHTASTKLMAESTPRRIRVRKKSTEKDCEAPFPAKFAKVAGNVSKLKM